MSTPSLYFCWHHCKKSDQNSNHRGFYSRKKKVSPFQTLQCLLVAGLEKFVSSFKGGSPRPPPPARALPGGGCAAWARRARTPGDKSLPVIAWPRPCLPAVKSGDRSRPPARVLHDVARAAGRVLGQVEPVATCWHVRALRSYTSLPPFDYRARPCLRAVTSGDQPRPPARVLHDVARPAGRGLGQAEPATTRRHVRAPRSPTSRVSITAAAPAAVGFPCQAVLAWPRALFPLLTSVGRGPVRAVAAIRTQWACEWCFGCACWQAPCSTHRTVDPRSSSVSPRAAIAPRGAPRDPVLRTHSDGNRLCRRPPSVSLPQGLLGGPHRAPCTERARRPARPRWRTGARPCSRMRNVSWAWGLGPLRPAYAFRPSTRTTLVPRLGPPQAAPSASRGSCGARRREGMLPG